MTYLIAADNQQPSNDGYYDVICEPDIELGPNQPEHESVTSSSIHNHHVMSQKENASSNPQTSSTLTVEYEVLKRLEPVDPENLINELKQKFSSRSRKKSNIKTESDLSTGKSAKKCFNNNLSTLQY